MQEKAAREERRALNFYTHSVSTLMKRKIGSICTSFPVMNIPRSRELVRKKVDHVGNAVALA